MRHHSLERTILFLCEDNACLSQMAEAAASIWRRQRRGFLARVCGPALFRCMCFKSCRSRESACAGKKAKAWRKFPYKISTW